MLYPFRQFNGDADLFHDLEQFRSEVNRIFSTALDREQGRAAMAAGSFPVNLYASDDELVLTAELPGVSPDDVELIVEDNVLTLSFERKADEAGKDAAYHRRERAHGRFSRAVELPIRVNADKVQARADNGILQIRLPRLEADKPRRITIRPSQ